MTISNLLFFGSMMTPEECQNSPDCPYSSNRFQFELLSRLLQSYATRVTAICPIPIHSFPERRILFGRQNRSPQENFDIISPAFINWGPIKIISLLVTVLVTVLVEARRSGKPQLILLYNPYIGYTIPALLLARVWRIPAVGIIADLNPAPVWSLRGLLRHIESALQRWAVKQLTALVPFSIHTVHDLKFHRRYMRLAPGVEASEFDLLQPLEPGQHERALSFSGTLVYANGLQLLLDAFALVKDPSIQLWISGRGDMEAKVIKAAKHDARIHFWGFLERKDLLNLMRRSMVLVNPRPAFLLEHRYNFPSKILEYLAIGRPVISTATSDVAQEYGGYLKLLVDETPQALAQLIEATFAENLVDLDAFGRRGRDFVLTQENWAILGERVADFLSSLK
jgi:glycosyltransferase involved in cell wall biosynthesis